jgi:hypothetical protein
MANSLVDKFLAGATTKAKPPAKGSLIFALDATASRQPTWDTAAHLQAEMFQEVGKVGALSALDVQLVYFRGSKGVNAECKASPWMNSPRALADYMTKIKCVAGLTQIERVLAHVAREASIRKIGAAVYIGDAFEEKFSQLMSYATQLAELKVPLFLFQEGDDIRANAGFAELAQITHGAHLRFDHTSARQLADLLRAVAAFTVGGVAALEGGSTAARLLLSQMRK